MTFTPKRKWPFIVKKPNQIISVECIKKDAFDQWFKKQDKTLQTYLQETNFTTDGAKTALLFKTNGALDRVFAIIENKACIYEFSGIAQSIAARLSEQTLKKVRFELKTKSLTKGDLTNALIGWGLYGYSFDTYKAKSDLNAPILVWPKGCDRKRVEAHLDAMGYIRDLINIPTFDMGPADLEKAVKAVTKNKTVSIRTIADTKLLEKNFPLIHAVGDAAGKTRRPRLIELKWGKKSNPEIAIVGKGVCFDTGGLDLKPSQYMKLMKKDMGGAAHALALTYMIIDLNLPVRVRLLIPAVENAVSGDAFRPGDIFKSRKGHFVENTNTDAEGRLILADSLTYACESKPDLVIDFATLTGSARAALGENIPAMFSTNNKTAQDIQTLSFEIDDPLWQMPLHTPYNKHIENSTGDLVNSASPPGDLIYSALFLKKFITDEQEWIHIDVFAWESAGRAGRTKGGTDMGLRTLFTYLEKRYA